MDLISIRRKYKNIRNMIVAIFLVVLSLFIYILIKEVHRTIMEQKVYVAYLKQYEQALENENVLIEEKKIIKKEEKIEKKEIIKKPELTDVGRTNMENLYNSEQKRVFLTFDDGPSKSVTPVILDVLKDENIKATFFVLGSRVELNPYIVKREYEENHFIASHGYSHIYSQIYKTPQSVLDEYNSSLNSIRDAIGEPEYNPHLFRFPGGFTGGKYALIKTEAKALLEENNIVNVDWNSLTSDAAGCTTTEEFLEEIEKTVGDKNSVVLLMHDAGNKMTTAEALPQIISYFRDRGYSFENFYSIIK